MKFKKQHESFKAYFLLLLPSCIPKPRSSSMYLQNEYYVFTIHMGIHAKTVTCGVCSVFSTCSQLGRTWSNAD